MSQRDEAAGRFAFQGLDRILHEKARLGIMASLLSHPGGVPFSELRSLCRLTDGNLSRHLLVLQEAGLVEAVRSGAGRDRNRPQTIYRLNRHGRERFLAYLGELERVVRDALAGERPERAMDVRWEPGKSQA